MASAWGIKLVDRLLRFVGVSAVLHVIFLPATYRLWIDYVQSGRIARGNVPVFVWPVLILYVVGPIAVGTLVGWGTRGRKHWARWFTGPDPAPRGWDHLFGTRPDCWIRLKLKTGSWLGGRYARRPDGSRSYVAGYPEDQDLYLIEAMDVDPETGEFRFGDVGHPLSRGSAILVRWSEVEDLELVESVTSQWANARARRTGLLGREAIPPATRSSPSCRHHLQARLPAPSPRDPPTGTPGPSTQAT